MSLTNIIFKKSGVYILIPDSVDVRAEDLTKDQEGNFRMIQRPVSSGGWSKLKTL